MMDRTLARVFDAEGWEPPLPASFDLCGAGTDTCCRFLVVSGEGPECARFTDLHVTIVERPMNASFVPSESDCQSERRKAAIDG